MENSPPPIRLMKALLLFMDAMGLFISYYLAYSVRLNPWELSPLFSPTVIAFGIINIFCLYLFNLYQLSAYGALLRKVIQSIGAVFVAGCLIVLVSYLIGTTEFSGLRGRGVLIGAQAVFALWAGINRYAVLKWLHDANSCSRWLILGTQELLTSFLDDLKNNRSTGQFNYLTPDTALAEVVNASESQPIDLQVTTERNSAFSVSNAGNWSKLNVHAKDAWSGVIVGAGSALSDDLVEVLMTMRLQGVRVYDLADYYEENWQKVPVYYLQRSWFAMSQGFQLLHNPIGLKIKRIVDICCAIALLVITAPLLILAAVAIKIESRGPILFRQVRVGEGEKHFSVWKLRSMRKDAEKNGAQWATKNDSRVTRVGKFLRKTRIDEIPQLINVLRGDMSFIGPRPERPEFTVMLENEIPFYNLRHILKPGITGWAQVMYPYGASVQDAQEKLQYDLYYIKNYSLLLDVMIVLKTIRVVLFRQGR